MENDTTLKESVYNQILMINGANGVFDLFRILGYPEGSVLNPSSKRKKSTFDFKKEDNERINEIYSILNVDEKLPVFLLETSTLAQSFIRSVTNTFDKQYIQYLLVFTINYNEITLVFPNKEKAEVGQHKLKLTKLNVNKEDIKTKKAYYSVIGTLTNLKYEDKATWREVWKNWKEAFSVERVTKAFFDDYKEVFFELRKGLQKQGISNKESHEFTLQFLNRIMFIYFISKKDWLEEQKFVNWLWSKYRELGKYNSNEFYEKWLKQVFLKAFNNRGNEIIGMPDDVERTLSNAPYLNGGLFRENGLDNLKILITDKMFQKILEFFESYNFTIKEDMPLESEVAVDPQMIGYVYESLANVAEDIYNPLEDLKKKWGIFYTPRVEVDFMCRRSLVEYLSKNMSDLPKEEIYHLVFDPPDEREKIEGWFTKNEYWRQMEDSLNNLSVVDPACGSGAFLVGMLNVVYDLYSMIFKHTRNSSLSDFALKNRIIQYSLYGVDVMPWAIHAAELRLWLQIIVETEFKRAELRQHPLLPNLNLNLRVGDSLVQEIGGISFNLRTNNLKPYLKKKLEELKQEKRKYFENSPTAKFKNPEEVRIEEIRLFEDIIDERVESLEADIQIFENNKKMANSQITLSGEYITDQRKVKENEEKIKTNNKEIDKLKSVKQYLKDPDKKPFVWDIDFAEIFADKKGFDIVIGNPPYVRYQKISPPNQTKAEVTLDSKREYKYKLIQSAKSVYPNIALNVNKNSDYYLFFYFHGLGLVNDNGTFCFITSNSWLDVEYGRALQEFLLKYVPIIAIYDNMAKKSFAHADVNTIIALFGAPEIKQSDLGTLISGLNGGYEIKWSKIKNLAKFVTFKKPFEECVDTTNLLKIEMSNSFLKTTDLRVYSISQQDLYEEGLGDNRHYFGTMWGGRYLRIPDILIDIQNESKEKIIRLKDVATIQTYLNTLGSDKFFFVSVKKCVGNLCEIKTRIDESIFDVEKTFLAEFLESPREIKSILIKGTFGSTLFRIPQNISDSDIKNSKAYEYIKFGKKKGFKTELSKQAYDGKKIIMACYQGTGHLINYNPNQIISHRFFRIVPKTEEFEEKTLVLLLNSTFTSLSLEVFKNPSLGGGVLAHGTYTMAEFIIPDPKKIKIDLDKFTPFLNREIGTVFEELGIDPNKPVREQEPKPLRDRAELDNIIFDRLELTQDERKEVYWSVCDLVKQRIDKARSLRD